MYTHTNKTNTHAQTHVQDLVSLLRSLGDAMCVCVHTHHTHTHTHTRTNTQDLVSLLRSLGDAALGSVDAMVPHDVGRLGLVQV